MPQNSNKQIDSTLRFIFILFVYDIFVDNAKIALIGGFCLVVVLSVLIVFI
jgi:hypothetical protein